MSIPKLQVHVGPAAVTTPRGDTTDAHLAMDHIRASVASMAAGTPGSRSGSATSRFRPTPLFAFGQAIPLTTTAHHPPAQSQQQQQADGSFSPAPQQRPATPLAAHNISNASVLLAQQHDAALAAAHRNVERVTHEKHELERLLLACQVQCTDLAQQRDEWANTAHTLEVRLHEHLQQQQQQQQAPAAAAVTMDPQLWAALENATEYLAQRGLLLENNHDGTVTAHTVVDKLLGISKAAETAQSKRHERSEAEEEKSLAAFKRSQQENVLLQRRVEDLVREKQHNHLRLSELIEQFSAADQQLKQEMSMKDTVIGTIRQRLSEAEQEIDILQSRLASSSAAPDSPFKPNSHPSNEPPCAAVSVEDLQIDVILSALRSSTDATVAMVRSTQPPPTSSPIHSPQRFAGTADALLREVAQNSSQIAHKRRQQQQQLHRLRRAAAVTTPPPPPATAPVLVDEELLRREISAQLEAKFAAQVLELQRRVTEAEERVSIDESEAVTLKEKIRQLQRTCDEQQEQYDELQAELERVNDRAMHDQDEIEELQAEKQKLSQQHEAQEKALTAAREAAAESKAPADMWLLREATSRVKPTLIVPPSSSTNVVPPPISAVDLDWDFDVLSLESELKLAGGPLVCVGVAIVEEWLADCVDVSTARALFRQLEAGYQANPYHNALHAADMTASAYHLLQRSGLWATMTAVERLAVVVGCAGHDHQHPGRTNLFMTNVRDPVALMHNDQSVLEAHHAMSLLALLREPHLDVAKGFAAGDQKQFRVLLEKFILGTDMAHHMKALDEFVNKVDVKTPSGRLEAMSLIVHAADIGAQARSFPIAQKWTERVLAEFAEQGREEVSLGLPVSFGCEPNPDVPRSQLGFIDLFVYPLFFRLAEVFPGLEVIRDSLAATRQQWATMITNRGDTVAPLSIPSKIKSREDELLEILLSAQEESAALLEENNRLSSELHRLLEATEIQHEDF